MPTTTNYSLPYPSGSATPNIAGDIQSLAEATDTAIATQNVKTTGGSTVVPSTAATKGLVIRGAASQSANLLEIENDATTDLFVVNPSGNTTIAGTLGVTGNTTLSGTLGVTGTVSTGAFTSVVQTPNGTVSAPAVGPSADTNTGIYYPAADTVSITTGGTQRVVVDNVGDVGIGVASPTAALEVKAGTATVAPVKLNSGTNLTTEVAGSVEYNGTVFFGTPSANPGRMLNNHSWWFGNTVANALTNNTSAQSVFATNPTLAASTAYLVEGFVRINTGATSHTISLGFTYGGTMSSQFFYAQVTDQAIGTTDTSAGINFFTALAGGVVSAASTATTKGAWFRGIFRTSTSGTLTLQITQSAASGALQIDPNSFIMVTPLGSSTATTVGS